MEIFDCKVVLPLHNTYVLAHFPDRPWGDRSATNNEHKWVVVKFVRGISEIDRQAMKLDLLPNPKYGPHLRAEVYCGEDEHANNLVPYNWDAFGPSSFFGQEASVWTHLPNPEPNIKAY